MAVSLLAPMMGTASPAAAEEKLVVWWNKGYYKAEEDALLDVIKKFEAKTGVKVELSQYATQDMMPKLVAALDAGSPPDVSYADTYHFQGAGKWASEGKLVDLGSILEPIKGAFADTLREMREDLQSSISYAGGRSLGDLRKVNYVILGGENAGEHLFM